MGICLRRRDFVAGLGGAAACPLAARAQQGDRMRRIGVLVGFDENDPVSKTQVSAFTQALADLGWTDGRNVRMDFRWGDGDINRIRASAQELVGSQPDIIVTDSLTRFTCSPMWTAEIDQNLRMALRESARGYWLTVAHA
jgi:putative ABC transport system substrate-binding protein